MLGQSNLYRVTDPNTDHPQELWQPYFLCEHNTIWEHCHLTLFFAKAKVLCLIIKHEHRYSENEQKDDRTVSSS